MADKLQSAREYILRRIDAGEFRGGEKLPSARELAERTGISFPIVQMAFNTLIADGILSSGVSRQGTCIRKDWADRILPGSFLSFRPVWNELFSQKIRPQIPELLAVDHFQAGACEIRVTYDAVSLQKEYLDLSEFLEEEYPDRSDFFNARIEQFRSHDGKLYALPLMFSPWVFCCDEELFQKAGCDMPGLDWTWEEFLDQLRELQEKLPANQILASYKDPTRWLIYLTHFGGKIFEQQQDGTFQCRLNSPETLDALNRLQELYHLLPRSEQRNTVCALRLCTRQDIASYQLQGSYLPLPRVPGDRKAGSLMAGDLLCIRKTVNNFQLVRELIREFLSPELQQEIGNRKYGIPIRKSAAIQSFDETDPVDQLFFSKMPQIVDVPHYAWPTVNELIQEAMADFLYSTQSPKEFAAELSPALAAILKYTRNTKW